MWLSQRPLRGMACARCNSWKEYFTFSGFAASFADAWGGSLSSVCPGAWPRSSCRLFCLLPGSVSPAPGGCRAGLPGAGRAGAWWGGVGETLP